MISPDEYMKDEGDNKILTPDEYMGTGDVPEVLSPEQYDKGLTKPKMEELSFISKHPNLYGAFGAAQSLIPYIKYIDPDERKRFVALSQQKQTKDLLIQNLEIIVLGGAGPIMKGMAPIVAKYLPKTYKALQFIKTPIKEMGELARTPAREVAEAGIERATIKFVPKVKLATTKLASAKVVEKVGSAKPKDILAYYQKKYPALKNVEIGELKSTKISGKLIDEGVVRVKDGKATIHLTKDASPITVRHEIEHLLDVIHKQPTMGKQKFARFTHEKFAEEYLTKKSILKVDDPVKKIISAIKEAKPIRKKQEVLYTQERRKRFAKAKIAGEQVSGEKGFYAQLKQMKGELPKVEFEAIRSKIGQKDTDDLFSVIRKTIPDTPYQLTAQRGLAKLFGELGGVVPTEGELALLRKVFPKNFIDTLLNKRPLFKQMKELGYEVANVPRAIMASFDLSFPLRQGIFLAPKHPIRFTQAFLNMFKQFGSERVYQASQEALAQKKWYNLLRESGIQITEVGGSLTTREEAFMGANLAEKIPLIGRGVRASNRAFTGFGNKFRIDIGNDLVERAFKAGLNPENNPVLTKAITKFVNAGTGRGGLGPFEDAAVLLNSVFFSPRLMGSRLTLLNPVYYVKQPAFVRKEALKTLFAFAGAIGTTLGLADMIPGVKVGKDPRNADFGKIKIGNTRIDIMGGFQQYIRSAGQLISGKYVSSTTGKEYTLGEGYKPLTRWGIIGRQLESKLAPPASFAVALLKGKDITGKDISVPKEIGKRFVPMVIQDVYDLAEEDPELLPISMLGVFGVGLQTYETRMSKSKGIKGF